MLINEETANAVVVVGVAILAAAIVAVKKVLVWATHFRGGNSV